MTSSQSDDGVYTRESRFPPNQQAYEPLYPQTLEDNTESSTDARRKPLYKSGSRPSTDARRKPFYKSFFFYIFFLLFIFIGFVEYRMVKIENDMLTQHKLYNDKIDNTRQYIYDMKNHLNNHIDFLLRELDSLKYRDVMQETKHYIIR
jgi:hypothetical protein